MPPKFRAAFFDLSYPMQIYNIELESIITGAFTILDSSLNEIPPFLAQQARDWLQALSGDIPSQTVYKHPESYPMLLFPWWAAESLHLEPDPAFQTDLAYSTINGYYAIRMIDNLMDGHHTTEMQILPLLNFFYTEFQRPYQRCFSYEHPFWQDFRRIWFASAEATIKDAEAQNIDLEHFTHITAQKTCAVQIPVAAICHRARQPEHLIDWIRFIDLFGCWHQMFNDIFNWRKDLKLNTATYFLSEAQRRKAPGETETEWIMQEGFAWGIDRLEAWMIELKAQRVLQESPGLMDYLALRAALLTEKRAEVEKGFNSAARLLSLLRRESLETA